MKAMAIGVVVAMLTASAAMANDPAKDPAAGQTGQSAAPSTTQSIPPGSTTEQQMSDERNKMPPQTSEAPQSGPGGGSTGQAAPNSPEAPRNGGQVQFGDKALNCSQGSSGAVVCN